MTPGRPCLFRAATACQRERVPPAPSLVASLTAAEWSRVAVLPRGLGPAVNPSAEGPGERGQGRRPRHSRWAPRAVAGPWCPQLLAPGHVSGLTAGCSGEEEHSPGSAGLCRGRSGQEGTEDLCVDVLLGQRGSSRGLGHRQQHSLAPLAPLVAAKEASSMPRWQLPFDSAAQRFCPWRGNAPSRERSESEIKAAWRRERQRRRERTKEPDRIWLHQWDQWLPSVR